MQQLRSFKPQSLGCAVARRKSSTTLIFPLPPQACSGMHFNLYYFSIYISYFKLFRTSLCSLRHNCWLFVWLKSLKFNKRAMIFLFIEITYIKWNNVVPWVKLILRRTINFVFYWQFKDLPPFEMTCNDIMMSVIACYEE